MAYTQSEIMLRSERAQVSVSLQRPTRQHFTKGGFDPRESLFSTKLSHIEMSVSRQARVSLFPFPEEDMNPTLVAMARRYETSYPKRREFGREESKLDRFVDPTGVFAAATSMTQSSKETTTPKKTSVRKQKKRLTKTPVVHPQEEEEEEIVLSPSTEAIALPKARTAFRASVRCDILRLKPSSWR